MLWQAFATDSQMGKRMLLSSDKGKKPRVPNPPCHKEPVMCCTQH